MDLNMLNDMKDEVIHYFAYGSNLSSARFFKRVSSAKLVATGYLLQHRLCFHKVGSDGSAKCDAFHTGNDKDVVMGAIYAMPEIEKAKLDSIEGVDSGYEESTVSIVTSSGNSLPAILYRATNIDTGLKPFHWYKGHVLIGAREHDFPPEYIERFLTVESVQDPDMERAEKELAIHGLGQRDMFARVR